MKITKRQIQRIIREEKAKMTKKYDEDPALKGDQDELPDALQKGIIDKKKKKKNESTRVTKGQLRKIIRQEHKKIMFEDREPLKDILDIDDPAEVIHAVHNAWEGGEHDGPEAENLVLPIDHAKATGGEPVTKEQEILKIVERKINLRRRLRNIVRRG